MHVFTRIFIGARWSKAASASLKRIIVGNPAYTDAREPVLAWHQQSLKANWVSPAELKREIGNASEFARFASRKFYSQQAAEN